MSNDGTNIKKQLFVYLYESMFIKNERCDRLFFLTNDMIDRNHNNGKCPPHCRCIDPIIVHKW